MPESAGSEMTPDAIRSSGDAMAASGIAVSAAATSAHKLTCQGAKRCRITRSSLVEIIARSGDWVIVLTYTGAGRAQPDSATAIVDNKTSQRGFMASALRQSTGRSASAPILQDAIAAPADETP